MGVDIEQVPTPRLQTVHPWLKGLLDGFSKRQVGGSWTGCQHSLPSSQGQKSC